MSYTVQPISIIINHKFITPPAISTLRGFSLSQNRQPTLAQPDFYTLYKSGQYLLKHKVFSDLLVSYDRWDFQPYIVMNISQQVSQFLIGRLFKSVNSLLRHPEVMNVFLPNSPHNFQYIFLHQNRAILLRLYH